MHILETLFPSNSVHEFEIQAARPLIMDSTDSNERIMSQTSGSPCTVCDLHDQMK